MIAAGLIVLVLGMVWEVSNSMRGAWPTALTWIVMATGALITVVGLHRRSPVAGRWGWIVLALLASAAAVAWLLA